ncbi:diaminobutyrate--2-oxoglutarate transaminase [Bacteriovorax sp. BSW11_IV]|uniref:diaminobutyrate--2-oxoglutarate transaminase n=1 Tax=Bacteriovorax sp. BSW11_IV TaxID=1353529 RepID=UPI000389F7D2|nr:diaminobutyrate--2-oxoglutarate transaminase [Bacteriovorax sp. BSW11_IV]EQC46754.1 diaminobutyrate--2-oxoglutarate transaminase [Bacteriovorax sp. BSW11_IV]
MKIFEELESEVRSYCRAFPTVFAKSNGAIITDESGKEYIDFFCGAGALNYGHNNKEIKSELVSYLMEDGILHSLDLMTVAKAKFLTAFSNIILNPRKMNYKIQFPGPTGTNSVEAAIKIARKVTGRTKVATFTNAFHGMTLGSLSLTGNEGKRKGAGVELTGSYFIPYDGYHGEEVNTAKMFRKYLEDRGSGYDIPAAVILETVQAEGGVRVARTEWLKEIESICREYNIVFIVDEIQVGCGRTGTFFSFEEAGISPDVICMSKSLSGIGLPFSLTLIKPELDKWNPGEHNGTFRGHNLAFVTATAALNNWVNDDLQKGVFERGALIKEKMSELIEKFPYDLSLRGRGLIWGVEFKNTELGDLVSKLCFENGLIIETSGINDQVVKFLPPLNIDIALLNSGLDIVSNAIEKVLNEN